MSHSKKAVDDGILPEPHQMLRGKEWMGSGVLPKSPARELCLQGPKTQTRSRSRARGILVVLVPCMAEGKRGEDFLENR